MLAILAKKRLGIGQYVRTTMLVGNAYSYSDEFNAYAGKPASRLTDPDQLGLSPVYRLYRAASGWVFLAIPNDDDWRSFCQVVDSVLADDPRFSSAEGRDAHAKELSGRLQILFSSRPGQAWEDILAPKGIGCVTVYEGGASKFACTDRALRSTGHVVEVDHPIFGRFLRHGLPQRFSETPGHLGTGCWAGQHTHTILTELGYSSERTAQLEADGIIAVRRNQHKP
jgi:crotonobetainyl-CoA:carnitine CoA-transferase CaiB-like acyl-CoA transferase